MLEDILDDSEEFSDCGDLRAKNDFCHIKLIKLISYDFIFTKKSMRLNNFIKYKNLNLV